MSPSFPLEYLTSYQKRKIKIKTVNPVRIHCETATMNMCNQKLFELCMECVWVSTFDM